MRVILDTNVIVSGALSSDGPPRSLVDASQAGPFELIMSGTLLDELATVMARPRIRGRLNWSEDRAAAFVASLASVSTLVEPEQRLSITQDEPDNRVLEAAEAGRVDYIVTGDAGLLRLAEFGGALIVTPAQFLAILTGDV